MKASEKARELTCWTDGTISIHGKIRWVPHRAMSSGACGPTQPDEEGEDE